MPLQSAGPAMIDMLSSVLSRKFFIFAIRDFRLSEVSGGFQRQVLRLDLFLLDFWLCARTKAAKDISVCVCFCFQFAGAETNIYMHWHIDPPAGRIRRARNCSCRVQATRCVPADCYYSQRPGKCVFGETVATTVLSPRLCKCLSAR